MRWTDEGWTIELDAEVELKVEKETDEVLGAEGKVSKSQSPGALVRLGSGDGRGAGGQGSLSVKSNKWLRGVQWRRLMFRHKLRP